MVRERQVIEDKIVQSVSLVSEDLQLQLQGVSDAAKAASVSTLATVKELEKAIREQSETSVSLQALASCLSERVAHHEKDIYTRKSNEALLTARIDKLEALLSQSAQSATPAENAGEAPEAGEAVA
jgi:hypothetical protein